MPTYDDLGYAPGGAPARAELAIGFLFGVGLCLGLAVAPVIA